MASGLGCRPRHEVSPPHDLQFRLSDHHLDRVLEHFSSAGLPRSWAGRAKRDLCCAPQKLSTMGLGYYKSMMIIIGACIPRGKVAVQPPDRLTPARCLFMLADAPVKRRRIIEGGIWPSGLLGIS